MRMLHAENSLVSEGTIETKQSGIGGDAKIAYAILTGMVTDKVAYAVREPGTNAWEANRERPFELTLPTRFSNVMRFRDFGPGLSHRFMMDRYPRIGDSTKDGSDQAVGGWGFGSKSPLAYLMRSDGAGAFDVISRHKGFRRVYSIGINANGKLQASLIAEEPMDDSDRGTGLEVSYPVRPEDVDRFRQYADRIFWGFEPAPVVIDAPRDWKPIGRGTIKARGTAGGYAWRMYENDVPWQGLQVRIGPVLYPVDMSMLNGLTGFIRAGDRLCMDAPIGSLSVSASRETLSYDDRTKTNLSAMFLAYEDAWLKGIQKHIDKAKTYFDACAVAEKHCKLLGYDRWEALYKRMAWRGRPLRMEVFADRSSGAPWRACIHGSESFRATEFHPWDLRGVQVVVEHGTYRSHERFQAAGLPAGRKLWVRVRKPEFEAFLDFYALTEAEVFVLDNVKLPKRVIDPASKTGKVRIRRQLNHTGHPFTGPVDLAAGGLYVRHQGRGRYDSKPIGSHPDLQTMSFDTLSRLIRDTNKLGLFPEDMPILIQVRDEELGDDWTEVGDFLREAALAALDVSKLTPRKSFTSSSFDHRLVKLGKFDLGICPAPLRDLVYRMRALGIEVDREVVLNDDDRMADFLGTFCRGLTIPTQTNPCAAINNEWEAEFKKHPLLKFILDELNLWSHQNKASDHEQKTVDHYFKLLGA